MFSRTLARNALKHLKFPAPSRTLAYANAVEARDLFSADIDRIHESPRAWTPQNLDYDRIKYELSSNAQEEISKFVKEMAKLEPQVDDVYVDRTQFPNVKKELDYVEERNLLNGEGFVVIQPIKGMDTIFEKRLSGFVMTNVMGESLVQNAEGTRAICVYDRDHSKTMKDGQRYHQSREGGSIHTDNVNIPDIWEYMFLSCIQPALLGGESIICSSFTVHNILKKVAPKAIEILREDFWWEYRGFSDKFYRAPILFYNEKGEPMIRYLRDYLESAYQRKSIKLTPDQVWAMDLLDTVCQLSKVQLRYNMQAGEHLLANDVQILHGRTQFVDGSLSELSYDMKKGTNRLYQRTWIKM